MSNPKKQLLLGKKIEQEHRNTYNLIKRYVKKYGKLPPDYVFFTSIASDHLREDKNYYTKLLLYVENKSMEEINTLYHQAEIEKKEN